MRGAGPEVVRLRAAIFEDGTTFGDPEWVQILLRRRRSFLQGLNAGLADLHKASASNMTRDAVLQELTVSRDAVVASISYVPEGLESPPPVAGTKAAAQHTLIALANMDCKERARIVYFSLIRNITNPPTHSDGHVMTLGETVTWLAQNLNKQRDTVLHSLPAISAP